MINILTRLISVVLAGTCWYMIVPVQKVLAASGKLNLDTAADPQVAPMPSMFALLLRLIVSLIIIAGLAYLTMKILRRNIKVLSRGANINVLDQYSFSLNKGIFITEIAGRVYVLGVTEHNINLLTEITDPDVIAEIVNRAREKAEEPIIPPRILERLFPNLFQTASGQKSFHEHIQKQIRKLQSMVENTRGNSREDDRNEEKQE